MSTPVLDTTNVNSGSGQGSTTLSFNCTLGASDNFVLVCEGNLLSGAVAPTSITFNGISLTKLASVTDGGGVMESSIWYLPTASLPTAGTYSLVTTYASAPSGNATGFMPFSGVNTGTPLGSAATNSGFGTNNNPTVTAAGGTSSDIYVGTNFNFTTTQTSGGSQTNQWVQNSINGALSGAGDTALGTGSGVFAWTGTGTLGNTEWGAVAVAVKGAPTLLADGTSSGTTTVQTGTGGQAMPAISVGQFLDIMLLATTTTALTETGPAWVGSSGGTFFVIRTYDDHANGYIWDHWGCYVTSAVAAPVIKTTWTANPTTALAISVGIISSGILSTNPFTNINFSSQHKQTSPNGTDAQVSGLTGAALTTGALYTIGGWGFSVNVAAAPAAGTGFTQIGTVWAALGTGACMTYETNTIVGAGAQAQATFTPVTGNTYTFAAAFNDIPLPVFPAGPMPRQIYIMP